MNEATPTAGQGDAQQRKNLTLRVAAEVRAEVGRQQLTHRGLAELLGLSQPQVTKRLNGVLPFDTAELDRVADVLGVPVDQFLVAPSVAPASAT